MADGQQAAPVAAVAPAPAPAPATPAGSSHGGASTHKSHGAQSSVSADVDFGRITGTRVKVGTAGPTYEGTVFAACPVTNLLALCTSSTVAGTQPSDYTVIPISRILNASISGPAPASAGQSTLQLFENAKPAIGRVDIKSIQAREDAAIAKIREQDARLGQGVSKRAQDIFDALNRTLPTRWDGQNIIVNDAVKILPPYTTEDCRANKDQASNLSRVKRVLENELRKISARAAETKRAAAVAVSAAGPVPDKMDKTDKPDPIAPTGPARAATNSPNAAAAGSAASKGPSRTLVATPLPRKGG